MKKIKYGTETKLKFYGLIGYIHRKEMVKSRHLPFVRAQPGKHPYSKRFCRKPGNQNLMDLKKKITDQISALNKQILVATNNYNFLWNDRETEKQFTGTLWVFRRIFGRTHRIS